MGTEGRFVYRQCSECSSLWQPDPPAELAPFYGDGYYSMGENRDPVTRSPARSALVAGLLRMPPAAIDTWSHRATFKPQLVQWLAGIATQRSKIADVGSGEGVLIRKMARFGFQDLWGIDPFISGDLDEGPVHLRRAVIEEIDASFDVVMMNHALEHVPDPLATLEAVRSRLEPGGAAFIRIPIVAWAWTEYGTNWVGLDPPRHLTVPSEHGMRRLAARAGFRVERVFYDSYPLQFWGSERYRRGIPLVAQPPADVSTHERAMARAWARRSRSLNRGRQGDSAGFVLRVA